MCVSKYLLTYLPRFTPVFTRVNWKGKVRIVSMWEMLWTCGSSQSEFEADMTIKDVSEYAKKWWKGPVITFPEVISRYCACTLRLCLFVNRERLPMDWAC
jgi:hypothetical protein